MIASGVRYFVIAVLSITVGFFLFVAVKTNADFERLETVRSGGVTGGDPPAETRAAFARGGNYLGNSRLFRGYRGGLPPINFTSFEYVRSMANGGKFTVIHDDRGFRVARPRKTPKRLDILAIGGSQTWGQGLEYEQTFAARVVSQLKLSLGNSGVSGQARSREP